VRDITERKRAEAALVEREELYRSPRYVARQHRADRSRRRILMANRAAKSRTDRRMRSLMGTEGSGSSSGRPRQVLGRMSELLEKARCGRGVPGDARDGRISREINASLVKDVSAGPRHRRHRPRRHRARPRPRGSGPHRRAARLDPRRPVALHRRAGPAAGLRPAARYLVRITAASTGSQRGLPRRERPRVARALGHARGPRPGFEKQYVQLKASDLQFRTFASSGRADAGGPLDHRQRRRERPRAAACSRHPPLRSFMGSPLLRRRTRRDRRRRQPSADTTRASRVPQAFISTVAGLIHAVRVAREERAATALPRASALREMMETGRCWGT